MAHPCFRTFQALRKRKILHPSKNHPRKETRQTPIDPSAPPFQRPGFENNTNILQNSTKQPSSCCSSLSLFRPSCVATDAPGTGYPSLLTLCEFKKTSLPVLSCSVSNKFVSSCSKLFELFETIPKQAERLKCHRTNGVSPCYSADRTSSAKKEGKRGGRGELRENGGRWRGRGGGRRHRGGKGREGCRVGGEKGEDGGGGEFPSFPPLQCAGRGMRVGWGAR